MKSQWRVTLTSKGAIEIHKDEADDIVTVRADYGYVDRGSLLFANAPPSYDRALCIFAEGYWAMAEQLYEEVEEREKHVVYKDEEKEIRK